MSNTTPVAPSYRDRVVSHLGVACLVLAACTGLLLLLAWPGRDRVAPGTWPEGTPIQSLDALQLSEAESAGFDAAVFGEAGRSAGLSLASPRLPAMLPSAEESLWQSATGTQLRQLARAEIGLLQECMRRAECSPEVFEQRGRNAVKRLGARGESLSPCDLVAYESEADRRVPLGLLAAALSWVSECRTRAAELLQAFEQRAAGSRLAAAQREAAVLYARFNRAKLRMDSGSSSAREYLAELRVMRSQLLAGELADAYRELQEQERWGLSLAEVRAEWMLAEARAAAALGRGKALDERIAALGLFEPVPARRVLLGDGVSAGEARLRSTWCALALRFKFENTASAGTLPACVAALASEPSFAGELRCTFAARTAISAGDWQPDAIRDCDTAANLRDAAAQLMERVAVRSETWREALQRYANLPAGAERRSLFAYLDAHAVRTGNRTLWFRYEHPLLFGSIVLAALVVLGGWCWWVWAVLWRRRVLWRFLPAELAADR